MLGVSSSKSEPPWSRSWKKSEGNKDQAKKYLASQVALVVKNPLPMQVRREPRKRLPWVGKIPWRRAQQSPAVYLPGESPWTEEAGGPQSKESDMTEAT